MVYNQDITLDLNTNTSYVVVGAKQGDNMSRTITATILENGEPFDLSGVRASYRIRKPNGEGSWNNAEAFPLTGKVVITLRTSDLNIAGRSFADILLERGTQRLGTVSFVLDVQVAPNIIIPALESEAFEYLYQMIDSADEIIANAEAWAAGTRGGTAVIGDSHTEEYVRDLTATFNFNTFKIHPLSLLASGQYYTYIFTYDTTRAEPGWVFDNTTYDMNEVGFTNIHVEGGGSIQNGDWIKLVASIADPAWHNNAKWYMEALGNATVGTVTTVNPGKPAEVTADYDIENNNYHFDFKVPSVKPHATIVATEVEPGEDPTAAVEVHDVPGEATNGELGNLQKSFDFAIGVPPGTPAGFANSMLYSIEAVEPSAAPSISVEVINDSPNTAKQFKFNFGIPRGATGATGAPGSAGINGTNGADGRSITNVALSTNDQLLISFSDGTSTLVTGSLRGPKGNDGVVSYGTTFGIGTVASGATPSVAIRTVGSSALFDFTLVDKNLSFINTNGDLVISDLSEV